MITNDNREIVVVYLDQVSYWLARFEISGNIDHFDNAERNANVVRLYLPTQLQDLDLIGLRNIYWSLSINRPSVKIRTH
jgi:hypothetical protein